MRELKPVLDGDVTDSLTLVPTDITEQERQEGLRFALPLDENLRTFLLEHFSLTDSAAPALSDGQGAPAESASADGAGEGAADGAANADAGDAGSVDAAAGGSGGADSADSADSTESAAAAAAADGSTNWAAKNAPTAPTPVLKEPRVVLSPREIQDRIRGGETVEELVEFSGMQPRKIESFAYPVLAERARIAELGKQSRPRRQDGPTKLTLWEILATAFAARGLELADATWDAYRDPTGQWIVTLTWSVGHTVNVAEWSYQAEGLSVLTIARNELAAELIDPDYARRNRDLAPRSTAGSAGEQAMPTAWQSPTGQDRLGNPGGAGTTGEAGSAGQAGQAGSVSLGGHGGDDASSLSEEDDDFDEEAFLQHPDDQPKRKKKTVMPSWEDVLLGVRPNGPKK